MSRGRHSNTAYVATSQTDAAHAAPMPGETEPTASGVLRAVLQTTGAEPAAHTAAAHERDTWGGIAQLAAEYEAIAAAATRAHYAQQVHACGLNKDAAEQVTADPAFAATVKELRRLDAAGCDTARLLRQAAPAITGADDPAAALLRIAARMPAPRLNTTPPRLIAGFLPETGTPMTADLRAALDHRAQMIEHRSLTLVQKAIRNQEPWIKELGPVPTRPGELRRWQERAVAVAAYRDRWNHTGGAAIRTRPPSHIERAHAARVRHALHARYTGSNQPTPAPWTAPGTAMGL